MFINDVKNEGIRVRVGGGFLTLNEFLQQYLDSEWSYYMRATKLNQPNPVEDESESKSFSAYFAGKETENYAEMKFSETSSYITASR